MKADLKALLLDIVKEINDRKGRTLGTAVSLNSYSSSSNQYTCPSDGIVVATANYRSGQYAIVYLDGKIVLEPASLGQTGNMISSLPVYKGQQVYCTVNTTTYSSVQFIPYV